MLKPRQVEGVYRNGQVVLDELFPDVSEARVVVTLLPENAQQHGEDTWESLSGLLSAEDAEQMLKVIEEECERIDPDGWQVPR